MFAVLILPSLEKTDEDILSPYWPWLATFSIDAAPWSWSGVDFFTTAFLGDLAEITLVFSFTKCEYSQLSVTVLVRLNRVRLFLSCCLSLVHITAN